MRSTSTGWCLCNLCVEAIKESKRNGNKKWLSVPENLERKRQIDSEGNKRRYAANRDAVNKRARTWAANNPDKALESARKSYHKNKEKLLPKKRKWAKKFREEQPGKVRAYIIKRRKGRLIATPPWANMSAINAIYRAAKKLKQQDGIERHVDHIIPLSHPLVCGLHVETNLQILTAEENMAKKNSLMVK